MVMAVCLLETAAICIFHRKEIDRKVASIIVQLFAIRVDSVQRVLARKRLIYGHSSIMNCNTPLNPLVEKKCCISLFLAEITCGLFSTRQFSSHLTFFYFHFEGTGGAGSFALAAAIS